MADRPDGIGGGRRPGEGRPGARGRRTAARLAAVQALYQMELGGATAEAVIREFDRHRLGQEIDGARYAEADRALFADLVRGVSAERDELDRLLGTALSADWPVDRLEAVLRAVLRAGAYELLRRAEVPPRVVINEYVGVADAFFGDKETGLVNGVLDRLARTLRPAEMGAAKRDGDGATPSR